MKREELIAEGDNSDYIHGTSKDGTPLYKTTFSTGTHDCTIFTKKRWKEKVKITIEEITEK